MGLGPVGQIADGAFTNLAVLTVALAQEDGGGRVPVGDGFDIHGGVWADRPAMYKYQYYITWLRFRRISGRVPSDSSGLVVKRRRKLGAKAGGGLDRKRTGKGSPTTTWS